MAGTTTNYSLPYPESTDLVASYPALGQDLAEDLDTILAAKLDASSYSPGLSLITSQDISAVSSVSINDCFSADYANYRIVFRAVGSANGGIVWRLRASGTDDSSASYNYQRLDAYGSTAAPSRSTGQTSWPPTTLNTSETAGFTADVLSPYLAAPTLAETHAIYRANTAALEIQMASMCFTGSTQFDGFTISQAAAFTGTVDVYGYAR